MASAEEIAEIMHEQLTDLINHKRPECDVECRECQRLAWVRELLMEAFRS